MVQTANSSSLGESGACLTLSIGRVGGSIAPTNRAERDSVVRKVCGYEVW